jgi:hypothetical protein
MHVKKALRLRGRALPQDLNGKILRAISPSAAYCWVKPIGMGLGGQSHEGAQEGRRGSVRSKPLVC